jgi:hypothetical protein
MLELNADLGANVLGFSIWRFAFGFGGTGATNVEISADVAELVLFGNVGEDGAGRDFSIDGSHADGWSLSGGYVSYAQPFTIPALDHLGMKFSVGGTVKYGMANGLFRVSDEGSLLTANPLTLNVEAEALVSTEIDAGRVWAADLGAAMEWSSWVFGVSVANLFSDIQWNEDAFELTQYSAYQAFDSSFASDTTLAFSELSTEDQQRIRGFLENADVATKLRFAAAWYMSPLFTFSADYKELFGGSLRARWERQLSLGAELRPISVLPLRLGLATDFNNLAITGGIGIYAGPVHVDFSAGRWGIGAGDGVAASLSVSVWPGVGY